MSYLLEPHDHGVDLVVTGDWSAEAREALEQGLADGLVLNYARGFLEQPIDFVKGLPIRRLNILARSVDDLSPVYALADTLEELRVESHPAAIVDLCRLPCLRTLAASWRQIQSSIGLAKRVEDLLVAPYSETDLKALASLESLTSLVLKECRRLQSVDGIQAHSQIERLAIFLAPRLCDISAIATAKLTQIQELRLATCKRIDTVVPVSGVTSLRFFDLSEGGEIPSVAPLADLVDLEALYLYDTTKVTDGDLSPIAGLPKLRDFRMQNRRYYSPSVKQIQDEITRRDGRMCDQPSDSC